MINNVATSSASAAAGAGYGYGRRRRQSGAVHFWLFLFTAGLGNLVYAWYVGRWNRVRGW